MAQTITQSQRQKDVFRSRETREEKSYLQEDIGTQTKTPNPIPVKVFALILSLGALLALSWAADGLFFIELLVVSAILVLVAIVRWTGNRATKATSNFH